jgi:hypothetical protein
MGGMFKELCVLFAKNKKIEKFSLKNMWKITKWCQSDNLGTYLLKASIRNVNIRVYVNVLLDSLAG